MEQNFLEQIQIYLNNYNIKKDSNENINLNKVQLLECFQILLNSKGQPNFKSNLNVKIYKEEENTCQSSMNKIQNSSYKNLGDASQIQNTKNEDMALSTLINKESNNINAFNYKSNNIDDIPIKGGSNFIELLEKELSKENNDNYNHGNVEPKFKYVPKKRNYIYSLPKKTKKYKYYSDNFRHKKKKKKKLIQILIMINLMLKKKLKKINKK